MSSIKPISIFAPTAEVLVTAEHSFPAGHRLPHHSGACQFIHGHNYRLQVTVITNVRNHSPQGFVVDFGEFKQAVRDVCSSYDHAFFVWEGDPLRAHVPVDLWVPVVLPVMPTAENIAQLLCHELSNAFKSSFVELAQMGFKTTVDLWETSTNRVSVSNLTESTEGLWPFGGKVVDA
jgi:6-pyruvoyltetrahydropterin/6-carboxytetrahydropterin synthase